MKGEVEGKGGTGVIIDRQRSTCNLECQLALIGGGEDVGRSITRVVVMMMEVAAAAVVAVVVAWRD